MKRKLLPLCFLILSGFILSGTFSIAQTTTWAQPGGHWYYSEGDNVPIGSFGYFEIWEDGDTTFSNGIVCDILRTYREGIIFYFPGGPYSTPGPTWYTYQSNDTVYIYYNNQFNILFIDNQAPGEQFITGPDIYGMCDGDTIVIDSLYSVNLSGVIMNKIVPVVPDWWDGQWPPGGASIAYHYPIYTRFGSTGFFVPAPNCITDVAFGPLRCYTDSSGFSFTTNVTPSCDYITSAPEVLPSSHLYSVMPNPAHDEITILSSIIPGQPYEMYAIFNAAGMAIKEFIITETSQRIDISNLPAGSYSVRLKGRKIQNMRSITFIKI